MNISNIGPLFIAQEAICFYPISAIYNTCPRYLFYILLLTSCVTRWTGWLADVFLGAAAAYAGTAAIQAFILVSSPAKAQDPGPVSIPYLSANTSLRNDFPELVIEKDQVMVRPGALELDADAVLAIVVTGYLVFLPLQCWSRVLTHDRARNILFSLWNILMLAGSICILVYWPTQSKTPIQYMFCYPDLPPFDETSSDGWQSSWRVSTWNNSVWSIFSNVTKWGQLSDLCYNPCMNLSQILRKQTALHVWVAERQSEIAHPHHLWRRVIYSSRYIYSLIVLCVILNCLLLTYKFLPYQSRIPSARIVVIWKERKTIWKSFQEETRGAIAVPLDTLPADARQTKREEDTRPSQRRPNTLARIRILLSPRSLRAYVHVFADMAILFGILFSMLISPLTVIAFVVWIEWCIFNDGPPEESPQQVGQWSFLVSIGLLALSAGILTLKYRLASVAELDDEIRNTKKHLQDLESRRDARSGIRAAA